MTTQPAGTLRSLPRWLRYLLSGARFAAAAVLGCLASALFYAGTCFALFIVLFGLAIATNKGLGSPLAWIIWPVVFFFVGLGMSVIVYTPITMLTSWVARGRIWVWPIAPLLVGIISFGFGMLLASGIEEPNPFDRMLGRLTLMLVLPYFVAGGYCLHWFVVFVPCRLGPWLIGRLEAG